MDLQELFGRFVLLFFSILVLYFFSNRKDNETINPLMVIVGLCTFSLCYLFTRIEIGVGIGFGLFAIFSILRFRTQTFTVNAIIFLFATITLSILDIMYPFEKIEVLLFFQFIIIGFYIIASVLVNKKASKYLNTVDVKVSLGDSFSLNNQNIRQLIQEQINIENFDFKIITINTVTKEIDVTVLY
jgi:prepilin signal peptidase PulO-like enzyme (type II secretory pathway)